MALSQTERDALLELKAQGKTFEEAMSFIGGQRLNAPSKIATEYSATQPTQQPTEADSTVQQRLSNVGTQAGQDIVGAIQGTGEFEGQSSIRRGVEAVATASSVPLQGAVALSPKPVREGIQKVGDAVSSGFKKLTDFIGSNPQLQKFTQENPDVTKAIEEVTGTLGAGGEIAGNILAAEGAVKGIKKGKQITSASIDTIKTGIKTIDDAIPELKGVKAPSTAGINEALNLGLQPEQIMQRVARVSKGKQAAFEQTAGVPIGKYLVERNIFGTPDQIAEQLYKRMSESKGKVDSGIGSVKGNFKSPAVKTALDDLIERDTRVSTVGAKSPDSLRIETLFKKHSKEGLTLKEVNEVKRLYERNVRVDYLNFGNPNPDKLVRATNVDTALRNFVEKKASDAGITTVKELNKETRLAKQLLDDIGAEYAGQAGNNAIGLTDAIFLAEATTGNISSALAFGAKKLLSSKGTMSAVAKLLSKEAGIKAELPNITKPKTPPLSGYLKFLEEQAKKADQ